MIDNDIACVFGKCKNFVWYLNERTLDKKSSKSLRNKLYFLNILFANIIFLNKILDLNSKLL